MKRTLFVILICAPFATAAAQSLSNEVTGSSGNHSSAPPGHSLSWTLGEPVVQTFSAPGHTLTQGFHQPEISLTGIPDEPVNGEITAYPVPTEGIVNINFNGLPQGKYVLTIHDLEGRILQSSQINVEQEQYLHTTDISGLAGATYLFTVSSASFKIHKTFRVVRKPMY